MRIHRHSESRGRSPGRILGLLMSSLFVVALAACGDGDDGAQGPAGPSGPPGPTGPAAGATFDVAAITSEQWTAAEFDVAVSGVEINGKPVVSFTVTDSSGKPVIGLENGSNLSFALAKLVPGTNGSQSKWISYIVTTAAATPALTRPTTDARNASNPALGGTLTALGEGNYQYTFYRDVTAVKALVDGLTGTNKAALGDLTWEPALPHRLTIQLSGAAPGLTGNLENPVNAIYDFIPATGQAIAPENLQRELVSIDNCNACHDKLAFHGGNRVEAQYCVVCHTEQRGFGRTNTTSTNYAFPALTETATVDPVTGVTSYSYSPSGYIFDGVVAGDMTAMVHKIHQGKELVKDNYNYAGVVYNNIGYSMLDGGQKMCATCHDSSKAVNAEEIYSKPTRAGCGSCHDGIDWATGTGPTLADKAAVVYPSDTLAASGHAGINLAQTSDAACSICHAAETIRVYHRTDNKTTHNPEVAEGLANFTYEIASVTVDSSNTTKIKFRILNDGTAVTLKTPAAGLTTSLDGFTGGPTFILAYALPQDGISAPVDYNHFGRTSAQPPTVSLANLLNTNNSANGSVAATSDGYYEATLNGGGTYTFPADATLRAVALNGYYTQVLSTGNVARHAVSVVRSVTGDAARRTVVDSAKCANCHEWFEGHGGNRVYEVQVCVTCHVPGLATSGRGVGSRAATYNYNLAQLKILADWGIDPATDLAGDSGTLKFPVTSNNMKDLIHGIHAGDERVNPFVDVRNGTGTNITMLDFRRMGFPGILSNCETCHTSSTSTTKTYNTVPLNTLASTYESRNSTYVSTPTAANAAASLTSANDTDYVTTPFSAACVSCHDSGAAKTHMQSNGGVIDGLRSAFVPNSESCSVCHGPGKTYDAATVHK